MADYTYELKCRRCNTIKEHSFDSIKKVGTKAFPSLMREKARYPFF